MRPLPNRLAGLDLPMLEDSQRTVDLLRSFIGPIAEAEEL